MKNKKFIVCIGMGIFILIYFIFARYLLLQEKPLFEQILLEDHWTIHKDGEVFSDVKLNDYSFGTYQYGDEIIYQVMLPEEEIIHPVLQISSTHSAYRIEIDGEKIYEYGLDIIGKNVLLGYGINYIDLPKDYHGKELTIYYVIAENDTFNCINYVMICDGFRTIREQCIENMITIMINFFLIIFGCGVLIVSIVFTHRMPRFFKLACAGLFSIGIAVWSLCNYNLISLFTYNLRAKTLLEFTALYWAPIPFFLYFWDDVHAESRKKFKPVYYCILIPQCIFSVGVYVLQFFNLCHMTEILWVQHVLLVAMIFWVIALVVYDFMHKNFEHFALFIGISFLLFSGLFDVFWFNIQKYVVFFKDENFFSALCIGTLLFVIGQIYDFCAEIGQGIFEKGRNETLEKLVYADALTGIANRRKCEEDMELLSRGTQPYGIFSFDLNNLKQVNDQIGHEKGDELIKAFSIVLEKTFSEVATVGRMGGDEFVVIIPNVDTVNIDELKEFVHYNISEENEKLVDMKISTAYGYCQSDENAEMDAKDVYKTADARMYKMKYQMKGAHR